MEGYYHTTATLTVRGNTDYQFRIHTKISTVKFREDKFY